LERRLERERMKREQARRKAEREKRRSQLEVRRLTQAELLEEAKFTEEYNRESLEYLTAMEEEKKRLPITGTRIEGPMIRFLSKEPNGTIIITFTDMDQFPNILMQTPKEYPHRRECEISKQPAKYVDPLTGSAFATIDAFKIIRERYLKEKEKTNRYTKEVNIPLEGVPKEEVSSHKRRHKETTMNNGTASSRSKREGNRQRKRTSLSLLLPLEESLLKQQPQPQEHFNSGNFSNETKSFSLETAPLLPLQIPTPL